MFKRKLETVLQEGVYFLKHSNLKEGIKMFKKKTKLQLKKKKDFSELLTLALLTD